MGDFTESVVMDILVKLGQVFCRIGDAVFKDFTEACLGEGATWADFEKKFGKDKAEAYEKFINHIIKQLGYDISNCQSGELYELVKSVIIKSKTLGDSVKDVVDDLKDAKFSLDSLLCVNVVDQNDENKDHVLSLGDIIDLTNLPVDVGADNKAKGIAVNCSLKKVIDLVSEIIDLIKKISDFEWEKLAKDCEDFGKFIQDKYINEEFGRRVLDYLLILLLKNARDVFADDVKYLIKKCGNEIQGFLADKIGNEAASKVMGEINDYIDSINVIENAIKELEEDSAKRASGAKNDKAASNESKVAAKALKSLKKSTKADAVAEMSASDNAGNVETSPEASAEDSTTSGESAKEPSVQLQSALDFCKGKLNSILEENLPSYNMLAKIFDRTYAILNLCGIIGEESVNLVEIDEVKNANKDVADKTNVDLIELASGKLGTTIQIPVFHWELVEKMFTKPKDYLKEAFPLNDVEDVERLAAKIAAVIRSFNSDFPEFKNIRQFVLDIANRIDDYLEHAAKDVIKEVGTKLKEFKNFLIDLLKVLERYAYEAKKTLENAFNDFGKSGDNLLTQLSEKVKEFIGDVNSIDFGKAEILRSIFFETFEDAAKKVILKNYAGKSVEEALHIEFGLLENPYNDCVKGLENLAVGIQKDFRETFDEENWEPLVKKLVDELRTEFNEQTKNVPKTLEELEALTYQTLSDFIKEKELSNPLSSFDPSAYFKIIGNHFSDAFNNAIKLDFEKYLADFRDCVKKFFNAFFDGIKKNIEGVAKLGDDIQNLAADILAAWLENIKQKVYELIVRPCIQAAKKAIKRWAATVVAKIISQVRAAANEIAQKDAALVNEVLAVGQNVIDAKKNAEDEIINLLSLIQTVKDGAGNVVSLGDGIQFAIKLYKAIPDNVKDCIAGLIKLPNIDDIFGNIRLPEYTLDTENKFFAVTLWKYKHGGDDSQKANVSIQLSVFVGEEGEGENKVEGLYILPVVTGDYDGEFDVGKDHTMKFGVAASLNADPTKIEKSDEELKKKLSGANGKLGFFISRGTNGSGVKIKPLAEKDSFSAYLELGLERKESAGYADLVKSDVVDLSIKNYPQKIFAGYANGGFDVGFLSSLEGLLLVLKLKQLNGFFDAVLGDNINIDIGKLALSYSLQNGFRIEDSAHVKIPFNSNIDLKVVKFKNLTLDLGLEGGDFEASLLTTFVADLKCVAFTFTDLGFGVKCNLFTPEGKAGALKLKPKINYPTGIGISIDASAVKGTGGIQWDEEKQRFAGALELNVLEKFGVNAMLVFTTGKGTVPFSFMGALSVSFNPGIQIGMGFSITSIGGSLGLNRGLDIDNLRAAVYDGSLSSILFVKDIQKNFDNVLANIDKYYPIVEEQMYVGLLAQISWGTILTADFGLFIQAPSPVTIVIAGIIKVRLADSAEKYLAINANFLGGIQFDKGIFFDASLFDSKIVGISIYGDMALRIYWGGDTKGFILSIGGFHPQYKPESGFNLVDMKRVGMKLDFGPVNMSLEAYFAITSNTVQFGSAFNMVVGWDDFGLTGHASFNVLFQFKPFYFMADMSVGLAVKLGSVTLCSISLDFDLSGPAKWHAKGKASICILFFDVSVDFNCTWGKDQKGSDKKYIDVFPLYAEAFKDDSNWKIVSTDYSDNMVNMLERKSSELVVLPSDLVSFNQSVIPFDRDMNCYGENELGDYSRLELSEIQFGAKTIPTNGYEIEKSAFAPSLTQKMNDDDKLKSPSYVNEKSGFKINTDFCFASGSACPGDIECDEFEDVSTFSLDEKDHLASIWKMPSSAK